MPPVRQTRPRPTRTPAALAAARAAAAALADKYTTTPPPLQTASTETIVRGLEAVAAENMDNPVQRFLLSVKGRRGESPYKKRPIGVLTMKKLLSALR